MSSPHYEVDLSFESDSEDLLYHMDEYSKGWGDQKLIGLINNWLDTRMGNKYKIERKK